MGAKFGDRQEPAAVSCRSGARDSMPGMMDTVLNIGLNETTLRGPDRADRQRALRLGQLPPLRADVRRRRARPEAADQDRDRPVRGASWKSKKHESRRQARHRADRRRPQGAGQPSSRQAIKERTGKDFPDDPMEQMWGAIGAVFGSWMNDRAIVYRRQYGIPHDWGTAVNVWSMVFGNLGDDCATGVAFTRDPATGENGLLRRLPDQRPGRGRRRRHPHAEEDRRAAEGHAGRLQAARRDPQQAREALPRRAGHRVHRPEGQALDAADPQRQADRLRRRAHRGRHGRTKG